jgi:hypothetical protein
MSTTENLLGIGSRVKHPAFGDGVIIRLMPVAYQICFMVHGIKLVGKDYDKLDIIDAIPAEEAVTFTEAEKSLMKILRHWSDLSETVELGDKWKNGTLVLQPEDPGMKAKDMPIDTFFSQNCNGQRQTQSNGTTHQQQ